MCIRNILLFSVFLIFGIQHSIILAETICYLCNSKQSHDCLNVTQKSPFLRTCRSEFNYCYTIYIDDSVQRGCVSANDAYFPQLDAIKECKNPDECKVCNDLNLCNGQTVADTCIKCTDCVIATKAVPCSLKRHFSESNGCYLNIKDNKRGCMRDLDENEQKLCQQKNSNCQSCKYPNCNRKDTFESICFECDGEFDSTCAHGTVLATKVDCDDYTKTCAIGIDKSGYTHRGCFSYNWLTSLFPNGFQACPGHLCNHNVFPSNRPKCYQCEGKHECFKLKYVYPKICNIYQDQCYAYLENDGTFYRGCMKEKSRGRQLCENDAAKCDVCDEDECNSLKHSEMNGSQSLHSSYLIIISLMIRCFSKSLNKWSNSQ